MMYTILCSIIFCNINYVYCWQAHLHHYEIEYVNSSWLEVNGSVRKFNKTTYTGDINLTILQDAPIDEEVEMKIYGKYSNNYKELPFILKRTICDMINMEYKWVKDQVHGNLPDKCPIKKGFYYIRDFITNVKKFPRNPWMHIKHFKLTYKFFNKRLKLVMAILTAYIEANNDDEYT